jgi:hypothetical protein
MRCFWVLQALLRVLTHGRRSGLPRVLLALHAALSRREGWMGDQLVVLFRKREART